MAEFTRRGFLTRTSIVAGVAIAGGAAVRQFVIAPSTKPSPSTAAAPALVQSGMALTSAGVGGLTLQEPMVVHVRNTSTGEIALMHGTQELVYRDPELVARLMRTASSVALAEG